MIDLADFLLVVNDRSRLFDYEVAEVWGIEYGKGSRKIKYPIEDVVFFKNISLLDPILGSSPLKACLQAVDLHDFANRYEIASFKNGGSRRTVMTIPADGFIAKKDRKRIETEYKQKMAGVENA